MNKINAYQPAVFNSGIKSRFQSRSLISVSFSAMRRGRLENRPECLTKADVEADLMKFCGDGSLKQVEHLCEKYHKGSPGFSVDCRDAKGDSPLILAARRGHGSVVDMLLRLAPDLTLENRRGETVLHVAPVAIQRMVFGCVSAVVSCSPTALCNASWLGNEQVVHRYLNNKGSASSSGDTGRGETARVTRDAVMNGDGVSCVYLCVRHTAMLEKLALKLKQPYRPQMALAILLTHIYDPVRAGASALTLLHQVAASTSRCSIELARTLVEGQHHFSALASDMHGFTPVHYAARSGNAEVLEYLICKVAQSAPGRLNAQLDSVGKAGNAPLHLAAMEGRESCVRVLLKHGASPLTVNSQGLPARLCGKTQRVKVLLSQQSQPFSPAQSPTSPNLGPLSLQRSNTTVTQVSLTPKPMPSGVLSSRQVVYPIMRSRSAVVAAAATTAAGHQTGLNKSQPQRMLLPLLPESGPPVFRSQESPILSHFPVPRSQALTVGLGASTRTAGQRGNIHSRYVQAVSSDNKLEEPSLAKKLSGLKKVSKTSFSVRGQGKLSAVQKKAEKKTSKSVPNIFYQDDFESDSCKEEETDVEEQMLEDEEKEGNVRILVGDDDGIESVFDEDGDKDVDGQLTDRKMSSFIDASIIKVDKCQRGPLLGKGGFGFVYKVLLADGSFCVEKEVAVREIDSLSEHATRSNTREIRRETDILMSTHHSNIVQCYGIETGPDYVRIFMELVSGGSIADQLRDFKFTEKIIRKYTKQLTAAINFLHGRGIVHRDIKGANVMVTVQGVVKLIDFGCAKKCYSFSMDSFSRDQNSRSCHMGSIYWMAPEVIRNEPSSFKSDVWSLGCTVFEMVTGRPPYHDKSHFNFMYLIGQSGSDNHMPSLQDRELFGGVRLTRAGSDFVDQCFTRDPDLRPSTTDLLHAAFLGD